MNLFALLLTYLFFCHPQLLLVLALIVGVVLLCAHAPAALIFFAVVVVGIFAYSLIK